MDVASDPNEIARQVERMDPTAAKDRIDQLVPELAHHNALYHQHAAPVIDDRAYDLLYRELELLEARFPDLVRPDSPTRRVGFEPVAELTPFPHRTPLLSLGNAFSSGIDATYDATSGTFTYDWPVGTFYY